LAEAVGAGDLAVEFGFEDIVITAGVAGGFTEGDTCGGGPLSRILDEPTGSLELGIDAFAGFGFWGCCAGAHRVGFTMGEQWKALKSLCKDMQTENTRIGYGG